MTPAPGARLIDLKKEFVLPGLIDAHVHVFSDDDKMRARLEVINRDVEDNLLIGVDNVRRTLEAGFTTVRDLGSDVHSVTALRDAILSGLVPGPTIVAAGAGISGPGGHADSSNNTNRDTAAVRRTQATNLCSGADDCRRAVRDQISQGADVIKFTATGGVNSNVAGGLGQQLFDDEMKAIVDTAHLFGRKVAAHAHGEDGIAAALRAGWTRSSTARSGRAATNTQFKQTGSWLVPTMVAPHAALRTGARRRTQQVDAGQGGGSRRRARREHRPGDSRRRQDRFRHRLRRVGSREEREGVRPARQGGHAAAGRHPRGDDRRRDAPRPREPHRIAEAGKDADIIAVTGSPLDDVTVLERMRFVMRQGVVHVIDGARQPFPAAN